MSDKDLKTCDFIQEYLRFITYIDFCNNARIIKYHYSTMDDREKRMYKWYVYANIHMIEKYKDLIWRYLNSEEPETYVELIMSKRTYRIK